MIITCTRPSTLAAALDDKSGLIYSGYLQSTALKTLAENRDLQARLVLINGQDWRAYKDLYLQLEARGGKREASEGTNVHAVVQALAGGYDISTVPSPTREDGQAVWNWIHDNGYRVIASEAFVATLGTLAEPCAGTLDLLLQAPNGEVIVGDIKTVGQPSDFKMKRISWSIQTAVYAAGQPYTEEYGRDRYGRPEIDEKAVGKWEPFVVNRKAAVVLAVVRGRATVTPIWLDLEKGWQYAQIACAIRALRSTANPILERAPWSAS